ncbi:DNA polymerase [Ilumatobacter sp.]|uniref:DNA polymerase n=1 Tax=Ilumatobacter sp. TaxID=1967498 RepID=UPI003B52B2B2
MSAPGPVGEVAVAWRHDLGAAIVIDGGDGRFVDAAGAGATIGELERTCAPRWVWWSQDTARTFVSAGVRPARCWDVCAVHRLIEGGTRGGPGRAWAHAVGLDPDSAPRVEPLDLFSVADTDDRAGPLRADGHLRAEWAQGAWAATSDAMLEWARLAGAAAARQRDLLARGATGDPETGPVRWAAAGGDAAHRLLTARSESATVALCAELEHDGLPFDRGAAEGIVSGFVGDRPTGPDDERARLAELDRRVLDHLPAGADDDLRSPERVRSLLRRVGVEVPDTRAWRLEQVRDAHPVVGALIEWRRAERFRTTFGYPWIDDHVGVDGRLRGRWAPADGAAGRMTATAGLHNMPAELRPAIAAEAGHVLVRADLGQIEPRILAAVSGDAALAEATHALDMYAPVADRLRVGREVAKLAVLGAMYGATTGRGAEALRALERSYAVAMGHLRAADVAAQGGNDLRTHGGRRIPMSGALDGSAGDGAERSRAAARGRYGRNAVVQGAAAEFFKTWAALVRNRLAPGGARIVLCLHDELIVHTPRDDADVVAGLVVECLHEAGRRWCPPAPVEVRFVADVSVVDRWSEVG